MAVSAGISVLFVSNDPSIFDPESAARARMRAYAAHLGSLHVLSRGEGEYLQEGALHLHPAGVGRLFLLSRLERTAQRIVKEYAIAVVSAQDPFELGRVARRAVQGTAAKLHLQVHTDFLSHWFVKGVRWPMAVKNRVRLVLAAKNLRAAQGVRVVSRRIRDSLVSRYPALQATVAIIPIAVSPQVPGPQAFPQNDCPFIFLAVGRLEAEKRVDDLIRALALVHERFAHACLMIAGDGRERRRLELLARKHSIADAVHFLGARADARALMRSAHCFVQASAYEGYGLTLIEAALSRIPLVTTDVGIVDEVFSATEDALVVPVANPGALAYAMLTVMTNTQDRAAMVRSAETHARTHLALHPDTAAEIAVDLTRMVTN